MKKTPAATMRGTADRIRHAILFEITGLAGCVPVTAWILNRDILQIGTLGLTMSLVAMGFNYLFNWLFDLALIRLRWPVHLRPPLMRVTHAVLFEAMLMIVTIPIVAWWLEMGLWEAFLTDFGLVLYFLVHAYIYNWVYDRIFPMPTANSRSR